MTATTGRRGVLTALGTRAYGVAFLVLVAVLVGLSIAAFQQRFTPVVAVTLLTDKVGTQLQVGSDVKVRGLVVGQVRDIEVTGAPRTGRVDGARLSLALDPAFVGQVPADVSARLLPKTLFGERFVDLVPPAGVVVGGKDAAGRSVRALAAGDVIPQDRSSAAIELEKVFDDLLPLLRTVQPQKLASVLGAIASTLEGRGTQIGKTLVVADTYFRGLNPSVPTLQADISGLADLASEYAGLAPDLLRGVRAILIPNATVVQEQDTLAGFLAGTAGFANTATAFLSANSDRIIQVGRVQRPTLAVLARYSPEYPCLATALTNWVPRVEKVFSGASFHITMELVPPRPAYRPGEEPAWGEDRGPSCEGLPSSSGSQADPKPGVHFSDGTKPADGGAASAVPAALTGLTAAVSPDSGLAGTAAEQQVVAALLASGDVTPAPSAIQTLLAGPTLRGGSVSTTGPTAPTRQEVAR
ncbi:MCE family protein [Lapillicoccus jejuensis]|uniref:Virulence factor Mce-like protein n=1 Tax=Lapillicoccus jejuensis TaxID=402171 RepID=A0A542DWP0_9MICO|nr:MCE family protein [Lapillicoccus jejuensis]TQJ07510.1 virulence factor Mce-like protein [Lapillicoccus jejuensis]